MRRFWILGVLITALFATTAALAQPVTDPLGGATEPPATTDADEDFVAPGEEVDAAADTTEATTDTTDPAEGTVDPPTPPPVSNHVGVGSEPPKEAKLVDKAGTFGLGIEGTLGFRNAPSEFSDASGSTLRLPALSLVYPASALFHFQVLAGAVLAVGSGSPSALQLGLTLRGIYLGLVLSEFVKLTIPFGLGYTLSIVPNFGGTSDTAHYFHLEAGLRPEWFVTPFFSIHTQAGAVISLLTGGQGQASGGASYDPGIGLNLFANTNLMAQAGFTVWFN